MNIKIDPVEYDNIAKLYKDGKTQKEISIIYGVAESVINRILKQLGVEAHRKIPISEYDNIIQLYESGKTQKEIGDIYGVANNTISQLLKNLELQLTGKSHIVSMKIYQMNIRVGKAQNKLPKLIMSASALLIIF